MKLLLPLFSAVALFVTSTACRTSSTTAPANDAPFSQIDVRVGGGAAAARGNTLSVNYTGWLYDASAANQKGAQFDASTAGSPFTFVLGAGQVISGWDQGVVGMREGGIRRLIIPPSLAYGPNRHGIIPPNATLVFDIELVTVR